jgi:hypothetical protein
MSVSDAPINQPAEQPSAEVNIDSAIEPEVINKYVIPPDVYFLKEKRRVPLNELQSLVIIKDSHDKMTLRGLAQAADGKLYKTSTYLGLKDRPIKKRSPRKKKSPKTDAAAAVPAASAAPAPISS